MTGVPIVGLTVPATWADTAGFLRDRYGPAWNTSSYVCPHKYLGNGPRCTKVTYRLPLAAINDVMALIPECRKIVNSGQTPGTELKQL